MTPASWIARLWKHCANALLSSSKGQRVQEGESPEVVGRVFGIGRTAIYRWLADDLRGGWSAPKAKPLLGRPPKIYGKKIYGKKLRWVYDTVTK